MQIRELPLAQIRVNDPFWNPLIANAVDNVIPYQWRVLNDAEPDAAPSHAIQNFRIAAGEAEGEFYGYQFQDSDLAKWLEAASFSLIYRDDPELRQHMADAIALIERAQQPDGYLDTHFIVKKPDRKWKEIAHGHELYCAGHMLEAAVACYQTTGSDRLLNVMDRLIDLIRATFGKAPGQIDGYPGHEEIELALMKAYRATGREKYLRLAEYFILNRGVAEGFKGEDRYLELKEKDKALDASYYQAHKPVLEQEDAEGHAVRAMYLFTGMADVALETGSEALLRALRTLWTHTVNRRMYITGGVGSQGDGERFTIDYDLPNDTCYTETCDAIGMAMWNLRMLRLEPDVKYADVMERALYNNVLSGISADGTHYFYVNPLMVKPDVARFRQDQSDVETQRVKWFGCACCPPNVIRTLTGLGGYIYTRDGDRVYQHLYIGNEASFDIAGGQARLTCASEMPWKGAARIVVRADAPFELALRVPGYARNFTATLNGAAADGAAEKGYLILAVKDGDAIDVRFDIQAEFYCANPRVTEDCGKAAVVRGPLVYCAEEIDNGALLQDFRLDVRQAVEEAPRDLFGGILGLTVHGTRSDAACWQEDVLYRPVGETRAVPASLRLIPYFLWNNRGEGEMTVWMNRAN